MIDESGISERPHRVRTWSPRGETPILKHRFTWKNASIIAGITGNSFYFRICDGAVRTPFLITYLKHLRRHLKRKLLIVWDGVAMHKSRATNEYIASSNGAIVALRLPPYAPELNPAEFIFGHLKERKLPNYCPDSIRQLKHAAQHALGAMRRRPGLISSFWAAAKLCQ